MTFQCAKCKETFEADGVQVIVHGQTVGRVCPACVAGSEAIQLILHQKSPGQPFTLEYVETTPRDGFTE